MAGGVEQQQQVANKAAVMAGNGGGGSRFAVTCGLLRQYMKEHGGGNGGRLTTMNLMTGGGADAAVPVERTTMELFPQQAGTLKESEERKGITENKAQLTIFYGGSVVVFDDFPAEKAGELMSLAGSGDQTVAVSDTAAAAAAACQPCLPDMPIARKVSLQRFLEKRKNRLTTMEPVTSSSPESEKKVEDQESSKRAKKDAGDGAVWLEVNPTLSL
uniref:Protein TIFY n=1 Tax=Leersia perrieri TaxID=77586 RepID=A0A0D9VQA2_9ORYZ